MQRFVHFRVFYCLLLLVTINLNSTQSQQHANRNSYGSATNIPNREQQIAHLLQRQAAIAADATTPNSYQNQQQTIFQPDQYTNQQQQYGAFRNFQNHRHRANAYGESTATSSLSLPLPAQLTSQSPAPPLPSPPLSPPSQSTHLWSGAPIVVDYVGGDDYVQQEQRLLPHQQQLQYVNNNVPTVGTSSRPHFSPPQQPLINDFNLKSRGAPHNFLQLQNNRFADSDYAPLPQYEQLRMYYQQQRHFSNGRDGGGSGGGVKNNVYSSYRRPDYSPLSLRIRDYSSDFSPHFENYVRSYPQRLRPQYGPDGYRK